MSVRSGVGGTHSFSASTTLSTSIVTALARERPRPATPTAAAIPTGVAARINGLATTASTMVPAVATPATAVPAAALRRAGD
jgi:hypothetical protein